MNKLSQFIKLSLITMLVMLFIVAGQVNVFANPISWTNQYEADVLPQNATPAWERNVLGTSYIEEINPTGILHLKNNITGSGMVSYQRETGLITSTLLSLNLWIKTSELYPRIWGCKLPIHTFL